jgi:hypothetical protein
VITSSRIDFSPIPPCAPFAAACGLFISNALSKQSSLASSRNTHHRMWKIPAVEHLSKSFVATGGLFLDAECDLLASSRPVRQYVPNRAVRRMPFRSAPAPRTLAPHTREMKSP